MEFKRSQTTSDPNHYIFFVRKAGGFVKRERNGVSFCSLQSYKREIGFGNCQKILYLGRIVPKPSFCQLAGQEETMTVLMQEHIVFSNLLTHSDGWSMWALLGKLHPVREREVPVPTPCRWNLILRSPQGLHPRAETLWAAFVAASSLPALSLGSPLTYRHHRHISLSCDIL